MAPSSTLLIADDDAAIRQTLESLFAPEAYRLVFAEDGAEALALAAEVFPDMILLDVMMPSLDGLEVCRRLRADPRLGAVPIVLITAPADHATRLAGLEAGADDFLPKPFDRVELLARVRAILRFNRYRQLYEERARLETERQPAEAALRESERFNPATLNALTEHIAILDETGIVLHVNQAWRTFARENGLALPDAGVGVNYLAVCDAVQGKGAGAAAAFAQGIRAVMRGERDLYEQEYDCHAPQERRWFIGRATRFQEPGPVRIIVAHNSITARKQAEEVLRTSEENMRYIVKHDPNAIAVYDRNLHYLAVSDRYLQDYAVKEADILGKHHYEVFPEMPEKWKAVHQRCLAGAIERNDDDYFERPDGSVTYNRWECRPWYQADGAIGGMITYTEVTTERKQAEKALRESQERFRAIATNTPDHVLMQDRQLKYEFVVNPQLGLTEQDMIGKTDYDFLSKEEADQLTQVKTRVLESGQPVRFETSLISKVGETEYFDGTYTPKFDAQGQVEGLVGFFRNVTERKRAEEALRNREGLLQKIFDILPVGLWIADKDGKLLRGNPAGAKMWGAEPTVSPSEYGIFKARRLPSGEEVAPDDWALVHSIRDRVTIIDELLEIDAFDGKKKTILNYTAPVLDARGEVQGAIVVNQDITERKRVEQEIQDLAKFPSEDPYPVLRIARDGQLLYINKAGVRLLSKWHPQVDQAAPPKLREAAFQALNNETAQVIDLEYGERVYSFHVVPIVAAGYTNLYARDITERGRAEAELAQSHEQLRALTLYWQTAIEAERARIAREIHDDFGQSMTALKMDLSWLANRLPDGDERVERLRGMNTLVDESIALMRRIASSLRPNLLDDLGLNAALEWQAQEFSRRCGLLCQLNLPKDDLALDPALSTTLFRIFQETLTNVARHAQATRVNVSLQQKEQSLILTIRDNGRGIPEAELNKPRSLGLLGLRERAALWRGKTTIRGVAGKGTTVTVRIPLPASPLNGGKR